MIITLISPDNLTMNMFFDFYRTLYSEGREISLIPLNNLLSQQQKESIIEDIEENIKIDKDLIFIPVKIPKNVSGIKEPVLEDHYRNMIPQKLLDVSSYVIAFDIYSVTPVVVKDRIGNSLEIIQRWERNLNKLGGV